MKERILDFSAIVKETLMDKFPLQEITLPDGLKSFKSKKLLVPASGKNHLFTSDKEIEKLACSYVNIGGIAGISMGIVSLGRKYFRPRDYILTAQADTGRISPIHLFSPCRPSSVQSVLYIALRYTVYLKCNIFSFAN